MRELKQNEVNQVSAGLRSYKFQHYTPEGLSHEPPINFPVATRRQTPLILPVSPRPDIDF